MTYAIGEIRFGKMLAHSYINISKEQYKNLEAALGENPQVAANRIGWRLDYYAPGKRIVEETPTIDLEQVNYITLIDTVENIDPFLDTLANYVAEDDWISLIHSDDKTDEEGFMEMSREIIFNGRGSWQEHKGYQLREAFEKSTVRHHSKYDDFFAVMYLGKQKLLAQMNTSSFGQVFLVNEWGQYKRIHYYGVNPADYEDTAMALSAKTRGYEYNIGPRWIPVRDIEMTGTARIDI